MKLSPSHSLVANVDLAKFYSLLVITNLITCKYSAKYRSIYLFFAAAASGLEFLASLGTQHLHRHVLFIDRCFQDHLVKLTFVIYFTPGE